MESDKVRFHPEIEPINCKVNSLPPEVIMEILSRVSILDLENLRYVCKLWREILESRLFRSLHSSQSLLKPNDSKVLILKRGSEMSFVDFRDKTIPREITIDMSYVTDFSRYDIIGSCNGLLCFGSKYHRSILVMNPFTHQYEFLPKLHRYLGAYILLWGFGIDPITNLFKVMVALGDHDRYKEVVVCGLGSGEILRWRNIGVETSRYSSESPGCFVNGRIYWTHKKDGLVDKIISFGLADEKFRLVSKPNWIGKKFDLFVLGGSLCIFYKYASMTSRFAIWIMKEYGAQESWVKKFDAKPLIPISHLDENLSMLTCRGLGSVHDGEVLLKFKKRKCEEAFLSSYDPTSDKLKLLKVERLSSFRNGMILHTASLSWI